MAQTTSRPKIVIVGAGFAGLHVAKGLARAPVDVTIIDRHNYHLFQPLLYQVAGAVLSPAEIAQPIRSILRHQLNAAVLFAEARAIDTISKFVELDHGELVPYDYLVLAAGATHAYFGHDEWARHAPGLKTLDDALEIRRRVLLAFERAERAKDPKARTREMTFVVVGAGPTGVELAGTLAGIARHALVQDFRAICTQSARVILVEGGPAVLPTFPPDLQEAGRRSLEALGVEVRTNALVTHIGDGVVEIGPERIVAGTVLWAAGVAASSLGRFMPGERDRAGRVVVEPTLTVPGHPELYVLGDLASASGPGGPPLPGLAAVAVQQGWHVARNLRRAIAQRPIEPFRYRNYGNMATIGRNKAVADFHRIHLTGWLAWMSWVFVHLMRVVGFRNRVVVFVRWVWSYATLDRGVRLITGDPEIWRTAGQRSAEAPKERAGRDVMRT